MAVKTIVGTEHRNGDAASRVSLKCDDVLGSMQSIIVDNPSKKDVWIRLIWNGGTDSLEFTVSAGGSVERTLTPAPLLDLLDALSFGGILECRW